MMIFMRALTKVCAPLFIYLPSAEDVNIELTQKEIMNSICSRFNKGLNLVTHNTMGC